jgi:hypothetical protein
MNRILLNVKMTPSPQVAGTLITKLTFTALYTAICLNAGVASAETITFNTRINGGEADCSLNTRKTIPDEALIFYDGLAQCNVYGQEDVSGTMRLITGPMPAFRNAGHYAIAGRDNCYLGGTNMVGYRVAYPGGLSNSAAIDWCLDRNPRLQQMLEPSRQRTSAPTYQF